MIKKFKNTLTVLKEILEYESKIKEIRDLNLKKEKQIKIELNELEIEKGEELKELEESLNCERVWRKIWGKGLKERTTEVEEFLNYKRVWRKIWESDFNINDEIE